LPRASIGVYAAERAEARGYRAEQGGRLAALFEPVANEMAESAARRHLGLDAR